MKKRHLWTLFPKNLINIEFYTNIKMAFLKFHLFWPLMNFSQLISFWELIYMNKQCLNNIPWVCTISESKNPLWSTVLGPRHLCFFDWMDLNDSSTQAVIKRTGCYNSQNSYCFCNTQFVIISSCFPFHTRFNDLIRLF